MRSDNSLIFFPQQLSQGANHFDIAADTEDLNLGEYTLSVPLSCSIKIERTADRIDVRLDIETAVEFSCSRCGEPMTQEIRASADITLFPESKKTGNCEEDATDLRFYTEEINLRCMVRDTFLLALPLAPLCREDCKGLCPSCGTNLNVSSCDCDKQSIPSPFEELRRMVDG